MKSGRTKNKRQGDQLNRGQLTHEQADKEMTKAPTLGVQLKGIQFNYTLGKQSIPALRGLDLNLVAGDFVGVLGPSGSGKTTLLNLVGLIEPLQEGVYLWEDKDVRHLRDQDRNAIRKYEMGYIFQSFNLFPTLDAYDNVEFFLTRQNMAATERKERVEWALKGVNLWEHRNKRPLEMSGGQRQRVAIARALAKRPKFIIADEPTASLDHKTGQTIMEELAKLNRETQCTLLVSSHDPMVRGFLKRTIHLQDGVIGHAG
ncbi:MAG: hypothetical protein C5B49_03240 [Bdellovibrio sp.]|nr:MAG: hypothetical protein C5B49_03240 [Bdellovibrio sp.]